MSPLDLKALENHTEWGYVVICDTFDGIGRVAVCATTNLRTAITCVKQYPNGNCIVYKRLIDGWKQAQAVDLPSMEDEELLRELGA